MKIEIKRVDLTSLNLEDRKSINEVLRKSSHATIFHSIEWNKVLINEFGLRNITLLAFKENKPAGLYILYIDGFTCRSPMTNLESVYGGPISIDDDDILVELLNEAERLRRIAKFQVWIPTNIDPLLFENMGYSSEETYTWILNLQKSEEDLWAGFKGTARSRIRKAQKSNVSIIHGDMTLVDKYYEMVVSTFTRSQKDPNPQSFYRHVIEDLGKTGLAQLLLAQHDGKFIAGAIFLFYKDTAYYWHGASLREYLEVAPNDLIFWELIKWARQIGCKYYDFLRIEPDRLPGIAKFKMKFGGDNVPFYYLTKKTSAYKFFRILEYLRNPIKGYDRLRQTIGVLSSSGNF